MGSAFGGRTANGGDDRGMRNMSKKGYKMSEDHKRKIGLANAVKMKEYWENHPEYKEELKGRMIGYKHSKKTRIKMSETHKRNGTGKWNKGKKRSEEFRKKRAESQQGEKSHLWKGGISPENKIIRRSIEFRLWREAVFARDNWTCQKCRIKSGNGKAVYLHPHHIHNFAEYPELRTSIENGITFCKNCHWDFHKKYGKQNNTKEQLEEFLR